MADPAEEPAWQAWLVDRNRRGARIAFWLTVTIYPAFALLDWLSAPTEKLPLLFGTRAIVVLWSVFLWLSLEKPRFERHWKLMTSVHALMLGFGIAVMVPIMGGLATPYYAGLNLSMMGVGLLFVWSLRQAALTHGLITAAYVLPNGLVATSDQWFGGGAANVLFVLSTATVVTTAQYFGFRAYREQLQRQQALERTTARLAAAHEQLKALDAFKSQFFANMTHELKTPLAMVLSPMELFLQGDLGDTTEPQRATLRSMLRSGMKLLKLINDLLDLSKIEQARIRIAAQEQDLVAYLTGLLRQVEVLALRKGIRMSFAPDVPVALVWCDLERIERVVVNLLSNALKFTSPGGSVDVRLRDLPDRVQVQVSDTGPGFPPEHAQRLFERFFQVDMGGTRQHGGAGIGLALARELTELHGGRIFAHCEPGQGAEFTVELLKGNAHLRPEQLAHAPVAGSAVPSAAAASATTPSGDILGHTLELDFREDFRWLDLAEATERRVVERDDDEHLRRWSVLVIDDTPDVIRVVHLALRQEFKVLTAPDGFKGLDLARRERPNLIITDLMMPGMDGYQVVEQLKADPLTAHIPVIMLTARGTTDDRVQGLKSGVNAYLTKPFSPRELITTARSLLQERELEAQRLLDQRLDSLESIATGIAHEINNPINYIQNALQRLQLDWQELMPAEQTAAQTVLDQRAQRMFAAALAGVARIHGTVEQLGRYAREGYSRLEQDYDLWQAARDVAAVVIPATGRNPQLVLAFEGQALVRCVPDELHQALGNLIQNGVEAADSEAPQLTLRGEISGPYAILSVADNGAGIPEADRKRIFEPFFTTKGPGRGMGLGLTITRRVIAAAHGSLSVDCQPAGGTTISVRLPLAQSRGSSSSAAALPASPAPSGS